MSESWEAFAQKVQGECEALGILNRKATLMTRALTENKIDGIRKASEQLELARILYQERAMERRVMQRRGFGRRSLRDVCRYAPHALAGLFSMRLAELSYYAQSLRITNDNNKALIVGGMDRLIKIIETIQNSTSDKLGTYRRRGFRPKKDASLIVSQRV